MRKQLTGLILLAAASLAFAGTGRSISLIVYNFTNEPGTLFLGTSPSVMGPSIDIYGNGVSWTPVVNGSQTIGLQVGAVANICYGNNGPLVLNAALYQGDIISIIYGQQQIPTGLACSCIGSACAQG